MPSLSAVRASNSAWKPAYSPTVVVAGGTNGIGAGIARAFAKYSPKDSNAPHIILIGRSRQSADNVIEQMKQYNTAGKYEFVQADLTAMKNVRTAASEIANKVGKVNYLCMSPGFFSVKSNDSEDGIDSKVAVHYHARFLLANLLIPQLQSAEEKGEDARVMTVFAAGKQGLLDVNDLGLKKKVGLKRNADATTAYNDLMVEELGIRYPKLSFTHAYPGWVKTNIASGLPSMLRVMARVLELFTISADECAEYMVYNLLRPEHKTGAHFINDKGDDAAKSKYFGKKDIREKLWNYSVESTGLETD